MTNLRRVAAMTKRKATRSGEQREQNLPRYFVWVTGINGPEPQKWASLDFGIGDWRRPQVLAYRELAQDERQLPLSALARRYPPPPID